MALKLRPGHLSEFLRAITFTDCDSDQCISAALALRDVLRKLGAKAIVKPVTLTMVAGSAGKLWHNLGVGATASMRAASPASYDPGKWDGHLIVIADGHLIDPMLPNYKRPAWEGRLPEHLIAVPLAPNKPLMTPPVLGSRPMPMLAEWAVQDGDYVLCCNWFQNNEARDWRSSSAAAWDNRAMLVEDLLDQIRARVTQ